MIAKFLVSLAAGLLVAADVSPEQAAKDEMKKLEGTWRYVSYVSRGEPVKALVDKKVEIKGGRMIEKASQKRPTVARAIHIDPTKKPKGFDITQRVETLYHRDGKPVKEIKEVILPGIYELDGDR